MNMPKKPKALRTKFEKEYLAEMEKYKGKGMNDEKLMEVANQALDNMNFRTQHALAIGPTKLAAMTVIMHAKNLKL